MQEEELKEHFKQQAGEYVELMERLVPEYIKQQEFLCKLIPFDRTDAIRVLDLGSGPGVLSELVLNMFPRAKVLAFDLTEELLSFEILRNKPLHQLDVFTGLLLEMLF